MSAREHALGKMERDGASQLALSIFASYFDQIEAGATGLIPEASIRPIITLPRIYDFDVGPNEAARALSKTVVIKLNGGLGTSMGLDRAKSLIEVRDGYRFLDVAAEQVKYVRKRYSVALPLILMNSFRTREDSLAALPDDIRVDGVPLDFVQGREPKLRADTLEPVEWPDDPELEWCPPGHGDIYTAMMDQKILTALLDAGYRYLSTSNADNLGDFPSGQLAAWFARSGADFAPEVAMRTPADRKGGHFAIRKSDGRTILREVAQTPREDLRFFMDEKIHPFFNTNNLWINLESLRDILRRNDGILDLPLIRNEKTVDPTDSSTPRVIQIESAMGAIVEKFDDVQPILVPRRRFLPIKTTDDLLVVRSDAYRIGEDWLLRLVGGPAPVASLDRRYYTNVRDFEERFQQIPSLRQVKTFVVEGDWTFRGELAFNGDVRLSGGGTISGGRRDDDPVHLD